VDLRDPANEPRIAVMSQGAYGPQVGVPLLLDLLDKNDLTTSWFIPGWTAERWPDVVADIHGRGHEIRHHGYLHEGLEGRSRDEEEEEILEKTSRILAGITGKGPIGYRAPLFEITHETVGLLRKHGFTYASNLQDSLWPYAYPGARRSSSCRYSGCSTTARISPTGSGRRSTARSSRRPPSSRSGRRNSARCTSSAAPSR
jgi:peptidoglycan/xylan/chitin deacetylase (PgdA/CDA1 family)